MEDWIFVRVLEEKNENTFFIKLILSISLFEERVEDPNLPILSYKIGMNTRKLINFSFYHFSSNLLYMKLNRFN